MKFPDRNRYAIGKRQTEFLARVALAHPAPVEVPAPRTGRMPDMIEGLAWRGLVTVQRRQTKELSPYSLRWFAVPRTLVFIVTLTGDGLAMLDRVGRMRGIAAIGDEKQA